MRCRAHDCRTRYRQPRHPRSVSPTPVDTKYGGASLGICSNSIRSDDRKISPVSVPSIHLGLNPERKGHVVYIPYLNRITTAYHLQFQESKFASFSDSMTSISGLPASIDPLRKVERTYAENAIGQGARAGSSHS